VSHPPSEAEKEAGWPPPSLREAYQQVMQEASDPTLVAHLAAYHLQSEGSALSAWMADALEQQQLRRQDSPGATTPRDVLPIPSWLVEELCGDEPEGIRNWLKLMVVVLNSMYGGTLPTPLEHKYNEAQKEALFCLRRSVLRFVGTGQQVPPLPSLKERLRESRFDYAGEPLCLMEELHADKVVPCWPRPGEAAVQRAEDFIPEAMRELLRQPQLSLLLPKDQWPDKPPKAKVRATSEEWTKICMAGVERKMMTGLRRSEVFHDHKGQPVFNGAMAVTKYKVVQGQTVKLQRFISNLIPANCTRSICRVTTFTCHTSVSWPCSTWTRLRSCWWTVRTSRAVSTSLSCQGSGQPLQPLERQWTLRCLVTLQGRRCIQQ